MVHGAERMAYGVCRFCFSLCALLFAFLGAELQERLDADPDAVHEDRALAFRNAINAKNRINSTIIERTVATAKTGEHAQKQTCKRPVFIRQPGDSVAGTFCNAFDAMTFNLYKSIALGLVAELAGVVVF